MSTMNKLKEGLHLGKSAGPGAKSGAGTGQPTTNPGSASKDEQTFNILPHPAVCWNAFSFLVFLDR